MNALLRRRPGLAGRGWMTSSRRTRDATRVLATPGLSPPCPKRTSRDYAGALAVPQLSASGGGAQQILGGQSISH